MSRRQKSIDHVGIADDRTINLDLNWTELGKPCQVTYPDDTGIADPDRTLTHTYTMGMLTGITGYASSIAYHPNLMLKQFLNGNNFTWTQQIADGQGGRPLDAMARPYSIGITGASTSWSLGPYQYDGAGSIKSVTAGALSETYVYDKVLRMTSGTIVTGSPAVNRTQTAQYSPYGFITNLTTNGSGQTFTEVAGTNRVSGMCYNDAGSVIGWGGTCLSPTYSYTWDPLKQMASTFGSGFTKRTFFYTADGERIEERVGSDPLNPTSITVSARGLDGKVLRLFTKNGTWSWTKDYVYRDGAQLASVEPPVATPVTKYFHLDHLGTIRRITNTASPAAIIASHDYYPFGLEATDPSLDSERMKWTGHERDQQGTPSVQTDDLDYMHARFENFNIGRFLSIDPVRGNPKKPQSFNLFAYARNNPINLTDPLGLEPNSLEPLPSGSIPITQDQVCDPNLVGDPDCPTTQALPPPETPEIKPLPADAGSNGGDTESEQSLLPAPRDWDYYSVCYTQPLFQTTTAGMTGVTFGVSLDQAGNLYVAVGGSVGKSLGTVPSFSAVGGMISPSSTVKPNANQVESFLTGWAMNFTVGSVVTGSGATRSLAGSMAGTRSGEFGLASPQVGVTLSYGSKVLNLNAIASRLFWGGR